LGVEAFGQGVPIVEQHRAAQRVRARLAAAAAQTGQVEVLSRLARRFCSKSHLKFTWHAKQKQLITAGVDAGWLLQLAALQRTCPGGHLDAPPAAVRVAGRQVELEIRSLKNSQAARWVIFL
jgi:hypothetical protein